MKAKLLVCIVILAAIIALPTGMAALDVSAFSCNGESGTVNIVEGTSMSCQATVTNTDANNAAALNAATLYITGTWADSTNYAGSGFDTSIAAGASTTATFSGITPTSSGVHSFNYVDLDGSTVAVTQDANVLDIRSSSASASTSSTTASSSFTTDVSVTAGGNMDVTVALSISGCSLGAGEAASKSLGAVADGATQSTSWNLVMGTSSSTCSISATVTGSAGVASVSDTATASVSCTDCSSSGDGSGGGGGAGADDEETAAEAVAAGVSKIGEVLEDIAEAIAELARTHPVLFTILVVLVVLAIGLGIYMYLVRTGKIKAIRLPFLKRF